MKNNNRHHKPRYLFNGVYIWILCSVFCMISGSAFAAYLENVPVTLTQPDGTVIECLATGDEYYNWLHDKDGYTIVQHPTTGYYCYAELKGGELVASQYVVGKTNPLNTTLKPHTNISSEKISAQRESVMQSMQKNSPQATAKSANNPLVGTLNNLVVYIRFSDQTEFPAAQNYYTTLFNAETGNSMKNYFREISYNKLTINSHFYPTNNGTTIVSYQDSHKRDYYCPYSASNAIGYQNESERKEREHDLLAKAINYIKNQIPTSLNLDCNNDGYVDNICFIAKGATTGYSSILWPHKWSLYTKVITINGKQVSDYNFHLEGHLTDTNNATLCHEMGHTCSAPDLYHSNDDNVYPVGSWDIMARHTNTPQYMGAYLKYKYTKWISDMPSITAPGIYTLNPLSAATNNCYKIPLAGTTEYLVLEYRQRGGNFELGPNISNGLLIYRINEKYYGNVDGKGYGGASDEVYIFRPGEVFSTQGYLSNANFSDQYKRTEFNKSTDPKCFMSDGSIKDIYIKGIKENANGTLSFGFSYCGNNDKVFSNTSPSNTDVQGSIRTIGTVVVKANDNIVLKATDYIELGAGFEVKEGGTLSVNVTSCK